MDIWYKFVVIYTCIGIMLYIGGYKVVDHDIISILFDIQDGYIGTGENLTVTYSQAVNKTTSGIYTTNFVFQNPLDLVKPFIAFFINMIFYPLAIANTLGLPLPLRLFMGAFGIFFLFSLIKLIK